VSIRSWLSAAFPSHSSRKLEIDQITHHKRLNCVDYEMLDRLVQSTPMAVLNVELMGPIAAVGIKKGEDFAPNDRMKQILHNSKIS